MIHTIYILSILILLAGCGEQEESSLEEYSLTEESSDQESQDTEEGSQKDSDPSDENEEEQAATIYVYVCGAVQKPDVYELPQGARIIEAIQAAGGFREDAATESLNLAEVLTDGLQIRVLTLKEAEASGTEATEESSGQTSDGKININTASQEELTSLPGIGESKAASIIAYRDANGGFSAIEDLMQVEGIKEGVFNKISDLITVG